MLDVLSKASSSFRDNPRRFNPLAPYTDAQMTAGRPFVPHGNYPIRPVDLLAVQVSRQETFVEQGRPWAILASTCGGAKLDGVRMRSCGFCPHGGSRGG